MSELPAATIVERSADSVAFALDVRRERAVFDGHFPDSPILPGVAQLDWVMALAGLHLGVKQRAAPRFRVKFQRAVVPPAMLALELRLDRPRARLHFIYRRDGTLVSQGSILLDATALSHATATRDPA